jgi:hypothetical protein
MAIFYNKINILFFKSTYEKRRFNPLIVIQLFINQPFKNFLKGKQTFK